MGIEIRRVTDATELMAVYHQRYDVYVEELKYPQRYADHSQRTVIEPLDETGHILGAFDRGVLVGSVRINYGSEAAFGHYSELYDMRRFGRYFPGRLSTCTKFIITRPYRFGTLMTKLSNASYKYSPLHEAGNAFNLIDSKPPLDTYFRRMGYRQIKPSILHPEAGLVIPLVLPIFDKQYLTAIGSPFCRLLPQKRDDDSVRWFYQTFLNELTQYDANAVLTWTVSSSFSENHIVTSL